MRDGGRLRARLAEHLKHGGVQVSSSQLSHSAGTNRSLRSREGRWRATGLMKGAARNEGEAHPMSPVRIKSPRSRITSCLAGGREKMHLQNSFRETHLSANSRR